VRLLGAGKERAGMGPIERRFAPTPRLSPSREGQQEDFRLDVINHYKRR
jgi:hypothetical protein